MTISKHTFSILLFVIISLAIIGCSNDSGIVNTIPAQDTSEVQNTDLENTQPIQEPITQEQLNENKVQTTEDGLCYNDDYSTEKDKVTIAGQEVEVIKLSRDSERKLMFSKDRQEEINKFKDLKCLEVFDLHRSQLSDFSFLSSFPNLKYLKITSAPISDISFITKLENLEYINLLSANIKDIADLDGLKNLQELELVGVRNIKDLSPLSNSKNLKYLNLAETSVSDLSPLNQLSNIEYLDLASTGVTDISVVTNFNNLKNLDLYGTKVSDITPLSGLTNMEELNLQGTSINNIDALRNLKKIKTLHIQFTEVSDLTPISNFNNLETLNVAGNPISDSDVNPLYSLSSLKSLSIHNTEISIETCKDLKNKFQYVSCKDK